MGSVSGHRDNSVGLWLHISHNQLLIGSPANVTNMNDIADRRESSDHMWDNWGLMACSCVHVVGPPALDADSSYGELEAVLSSC